MRKLAIFVLALGISHLGYANNSLTLPWEEFKTLYTEQVQQRLEAQQPKKNVESIVSLDTANYTIDISNDKAVIDFSMRGQRLQGEATAIPLFGKNVALTDIFDIQNSTIISDGGAYKLYIGGLPANKESGQESVGSFQLTARLLVDIEEDKHSQYIDIKIPAAVRNRLDIKLPENYVLLGTGNSLPLGGMDKNKSSYFSPRDRLVLKFIDKKATAQYPPVVDLSTVVALQDKQYILTVYGKLREPYAGEIALKHPSLHFLDSSLKSSIIRQKGEKLFIDTRGGVEDVFTLRFSLDVNPQSTQLKLPSILHNNGHQQYFQIIDPVESQILVSGKAGANIGRYWQVPTLVRELSQKNTSFYRSEKRDDIRLTLQRFRPVAAPELVLDKIYFYTSFAENGSAISVLKMALPKSAGDRLSIEPIADAKIWSLKVNGQKKEVYTQKNTHGKESWIIPLSANKESMVELTYLQKGKRLKLEGRLPITVPAIGVAAQSIIVNIGLSDRVELVAMEGGLSAENSDKKPPLVQNFSGRSHVFHYPFYRGQALQAAIFYKEPLLESRR